MNMILLQTLARANAMMKKGVLQLQWFPKIRCLTPALQGVGGQIHSNNNYASGGHPVASWMLHTGGKAGA